MKVCIACQANVEGKRAVPVKEDRIIKVIRTVKRALGIAQMNELYVCEEHVKEHKKRRRSFEKSMLFASVLAGIVVVMVLGALLFSGRFDAWAIASAFVIGAFILLLPLFKYIPALEGAPPTSIAAPEAKRPAKAKKPKARRKKR